MVKITNVFGDVYSGTVAKTGVYSSWHGIQYRRKHVIPHNPKTSKQTTVRTNFTNAVAHWKTGLNSLQHAAYKYLSSGMAMSGFNLFVERWQKNSGTIRTTNPAYGLKTIGTALNYHASVTVGAVAEASLTIDANSVLSIDNAVPSASVAGGVQDATSTTGAKAWIDLKIGQVRQITAPANAYYLTYKVGGNQIIGEALSFVNGVAQTKNFPIDYGTCELVDKASAPTTVHDAAAVLAGEVDIVAGKIHTTYTSGGTTFTAASNVKYTTVSFLANVKVQVTKANSSFVCFRGYSDANGFVELAVTPDDANYDVVISATGYTTITRSNQSAAQTAVSESIKLS